MCYKSICNIIVWIVKTIKFRIKTIIDPKNVYEANYILFIILRHLNIFPMKISINHNLNHSLQFDTRRLLLYIIFALTNLSLDATLFWQGLTNDSSIHKTTQLITTCSCTVFSALLLIRLTFFKIDTLNNIFMNLLRLDYDFQAVELKMVHKLTLYFHLIIITFILFFHIPVLVVFFKLTFFHYIMILMYHVSLMVPFTNATLIMYFYFTLILMLYLRLKLLSNRFKKNFDHPKYIFVHAKIFNNICDVAELINLNISVLLNAAFCISYIYLVVFFYNLIKLLKFQIINYQIIFFGWLSSNILVAMFSLFYICQKCTSEVIHNKFS